VVKLSSFNHFKANYVYAEGLAVELGMEDCFAARGLEFDLNIEVLQDY
jgi:hypothetical protein